MSKQLASVTATRNGPPSGAARHIPGEPGIWILLFGDMLVFTVLFAVYLRNRHANPELFAESQEALHRTIGVVNTVVLLTSSLLVVLGTSAVRNGQVALARRLLFAGAAVGACFVLLKAVEYQSLFAAGIAPSTNQFFMYYFVLTGLHLAHVLLGLVLLISLAATMPSTEPTATRVAFAEGGACFWHMVDLLWIIIFPLVFLVR
ncbi:cytochrome c oxidase subunit 3 [Mycolicibacterium neoaurum]|uniref:cytochrome c oxidase subunit 3 n=1 Tax=Mycolicibacterium neoaurum TaxID=1795 RepID=UPI0026717ABC|nr:cytochrome c oxidase subunit 3 [Mycolicibacterium neoaurum]MDO3402770.1 cytochrome c oxidase subunit 3 [Mycolicibacterium neoaurum]